MDPIRLRDFVEDEDGWLYAVATYDNADRVGCVLRYVPDPAGERINASGTRYRKLDFGPAYELIREEKPQYLDVLHRIPRDEIRRVYKPDISLPEIAARDPRVSRLSEIFGVPAGQMGCTGSLLLGLEGEGSDIDFVIYGQEWFTARKNLGVAIRKGYLEPMSEELWETVYRKRKPELDFNDFVLHEERKGNRGQIDGVYFDLLYTRDYHEINPQASPRGEVISKMTIEAKVTDAQYAFDNPAVFMVRHETITRVLSFTHTYSGQVESGETMEACGICERHGDEFWLIVGTTREARGEYILSRTLMDGKK